MFTGQPLQIEKAALKRKWEDSLCERLAASEDYAVEYLNVVLEEDDPQAFLPTLRHVAEARGGMDKLAVEA